MNVNSIVENVFQIKSGIRINVDVSVKIRKNMHMKKILNPATCSSQNGEYYCIIGDSVIMCNGIIDMVQSDLSHASYAR